MFTRLDGYQVSELIPLNRSIVSLRIYEAISPPDPDLDNCPDYLRKRFVMKVPRHRLASEIYPVDLHLRPHALKTQRLFKKRAAKCRERGVDFFSNT